MNSLTAKVSSKVWEMLYNPRVVGVSLRALSESSSDKGALEELTVGEKRILARLKETFPDATEINVSDISGGCGAMYMISIESSQFAGKRTVMQHRMVNEALAEEIKGMHGLQLKTKAPDAGNS